MNKTKRPLIPAVFTAISVALFLGSLASPAFHTDHGGNDDWYGLALFLIGWLGVLGGIPAWLGNPALLAALVLLWFRRVRFLGILCAVAGIGLALTFLRMKTIDYDEAGHKANIIRYGPGYWLWIASMGTPALGCFFAMINDWAARLVDGGDQLNHPRVTRASSPCVEPPGVKLHPRNGVRERQRCRASLGAVRPSS